MKIPFWTAWCARKRARAFAKELAFERRIRLDEWIDVYHQHQLNEDMVLPGDPPYYDTCPAVGDGHGHFLPRSPLPESLAPEEARP